MTNIDEIIDYSQKVIRSIKSDNLIMGLISDKKDFDENADYADEMYDKITDYTWIDGVDLKVGAHVMVDTDIVDAPSGSTKQLRIYVRIVCARSFMKHSIPGLKGNRRDNLARLIDANINHDKDYGIGKVNLLSASVVEVTDHYSSRELIYDVRAFTDGYNDD